MSGGDVVTLSPSCIVYILRQWFALSKTTSEYKRAYTHATVDIYILHERRKSITGVITKPIGRVARIYEIIVEESERTCVNRYDNVTRVRYKRKLTDRK